MRFWVLNGAERVLRIRNEVLCMLAWLKNKMSPCLLSNLRDTFMVLRGEGIRAMVLLLVWTLNCVYQDPKNSNEIFAEKFYLCLRSTSIKSR